MRLLRCFTCVNMICLPLLLCVTGCKVVERQKGSHEGNAGSVTQTKGTESLRLSAEDAQLRTKLQPIVKSVNGCLTHYEDFAGSYRDRVKSTAHYDPKIDPGVNGNATFELTNGDTGTGTLDCASDLERGASLPPAVADLDQASRATASALRAMLGPGLQLDQYLYRKEYLDDRFAKGHQLDATVGPLLAKTLDSTRVLRAAVRRSNGMVRQHELEAIDRREGHSLNWHTHATLIAARATDEAIQDAVRTGALTDDSVAKAIQPFQEAMQATRNYLAQHPDEAKKAEDQKGMWSFVEKPLNDELNEARELRVQISAPDPFGQQNRRRDLDMQANSVNTEFNAAVRMQNFAIEHP